MRLTVACHKDVKQCDYDDSSAIAVAEVVGMVGVVDGSTMVGACKVEVEVGERIVVEADSGIGVGAGCNCDGC